MKLNIILFSVYQSKKNFLALGALSFCIYSLNRAQFGKTLFCVVRYLSGSDLYFVKSTSLNTTSVASCYQCYKFLKLKRNPQQDSMFRAKKLTSSNESCLVMQWIVKISLGSEKITGLIFSAFKIIVSPVNNPGFLITFEHYKHKKHFEQKSWTLKPKIDVLKEINSRMCILQLSAPIRGWEDSVVL